MKTRPVILYFNGLRGSGVNRRERLAMTYWQRRGLRVVHAQVNWLAHEPFERLLERSVALAKGQLGSGDLVILVGASAGCSLAVNVLAALRERRVMAVLLCGRLGPGRLPWWDPRSLERMAHLGSAGESRLFFESVQRCEQVLQGFSADERRRVTNVVQLADFVVPRSSMALPGASRVVIPVIGHGLGIMMGWWLLPQLVRGVVARGVRFLE